MCADCFRRGRVEVKCNVTECDKEERKSHVEQLG